MSRAVPLRRRSTTQRGTGLAVALTTVAVLVGTAALVWHAAYAAFSDVAYTPAVPVSTATVALSDDDAGTAFFDATDLRPGATATRCITVTSTSSTPTTVKVYATSRTTTTLSGALRITVDAGSGSCAAFVPGGSPVTASLSAFPTSYTAGVTSWTTTGVSGESRPYQVTYSLPSGTTTGAQSGAASLGFTWEAQTP
jgi:hypothetical protein